MRERESGQVMAIDIYVPGIPGAGRSSVDVQLLSNRQPGRRDFEFRNLVDPSFDWSLLWLER